jgi:hypothetical protein
LGRRKKITCGGVAAAAESSKYPECPFLSVLIKPNFFICMNYIKIIYTDPQETVAFSSLASSQPDAFASWTDQTARKKINNLTPDPIG